MNNVKSNLREILPFSDPIAYIALPFLNACMLVFSVAMAENQSMFLDAYANDAAWLGRCGGPGELGYALIRPLVMI